MDDDTEKRLWPFSSSPRFAVIGSIIAVRSFKSKAGEKKRPSREQVVGLKERARTYGNWWASLRKE